MNIEWLFPTILAPNSLDNFQMKTKLAEQWAITLRLEDGSEKWKVAVQARLLATDLQSPGPIGGMSTNKEILVLPLIHLPGCE